MSRNPAPVPFSQAPLVIGPRTISKTVCVRIPTPSCRLHGHQSCWEWPPHGPLWVFLLSRRDLNSGTHADRKQGSPTALVSASSRQVTSSRAHRCSGPSRRHPGCPRNRPSSAGKSRKRALPGHPLASPLPGHPLARLGDSASRTLPLLLSVHHPVFSRHHREPSAPSSARSASLLTSPSLVLEARLPEIRERAEPQ